MITILTLSPQQAAFAAVAPCLMQFCIMAHIPYPEEETARHQLGRLYRRACLASYMDSPTHRQTANG